MTAVSVNIMCLVVLISTLIWWQSAKGMLEVKPDTVVITSNHESQPHYGSMKMAPLIITTEILYSCLEIHSNASLRRPRGNVIWIWNNDILNTTGSKYRKYGKKKRLLIKELTYEDSGVYECAFASNITEKGRTELWIAPNVVSSPKVQNFRIHTSINVTCLVTGGIRDVEWQRNNQTIAHSNTFIANSRYEVLSSGSLHIFNITEQDSGHYRCIVSNKAGKHSQNIEVNVMNEFTQYQHNEQHDIFPLDNNGCVTQMGFIKEFFQDIKDSSPDYYTEQDIPYFTAKPPHCIQTKEGFNVVNVRLID